GKGRHFQARCNQLPLGRAAACHIYGKQHGQNDEYELAHLNISRTYLRREGRLRLCGSPWCAPVQPGSGESSHALSSGGRIRRTRHRRGSRGEETPTARKPPGSDKKSTFRSRRDAFFTPT